MISFFMCGSHTGCPGGAGVPAGVPGRPGVYGRSPRGARGGDREGARGARGGVAGGRGRPAGGMGAHPEPREGEGGGLAADIMVKRYDDLT